MSENIKNTNLEKVEVMEVESDSMKELNKISNEIEEMSKTRFKAEDIPELSSKISDLDKEVVGKLSKIVLKIKEENLHNERVKNSIVSKLYDAFYRGTKVVASVVGAQESISNAENKMKNEILSNSSVQEALNLIFISAKKNNEEIKRIVQDFIKYNSKNEEDLKKMYEFKNKLSKVVDFNEISQEDAFKTQMELGIEIEITNLNSKMERIKEGYVLGKSTINRSEKNLDYMEYMMKEGLLLNEKFLTIKNGMENMNDIQELLFEMTKNSNEINKSTTLEMLEFENKNIKSIKLMREEDKKNIEFKEQLLVANQKLHKEQNKILKETILANENFLISNQDKKPIPIKNKSN
jgi:hypothetical protein